MITFGFGAGALFSTGDRQDQICRLVDGSWRFPGHGSGKVPGCPGALHCGESGEAAASLRNADDQRFAAEGKCHLVQQEGPVYIDRDAAPLLHKRPRGQRAVVRRTGTGQDDSRDPAIRQRFRRLPEIFPRLR